jgi:hypothetical protein
MVSEDARREGRGHITLPKRHYINCLNICAEGNIFKVVSEDARRKGRGHITFLPP